MNSPPVDAGAIARAAGLLRDGKLVAFPTETVYGLGADADNVFAVRAIFEAKGRPADHPVIVHVADLQAAAVWASELSPAARKLADRFWPGPLTLVVARGARAHDQLTGAQPSVGLRCPSHPWAQALLNALCRESHDPCRAIAAPNACWCNGRRGIRSGPRYTIGSSGPPPRSAESSTTPTERLAIRRP